MRSILKYPGSKGNIANQLVELIPPHKSYLEAYAGSLAVLFQKPPSAIETVNDLDGDVVNLFRCIQQDAGKLASRVMTTPYSREVYDLQFTPMTEADPYKRACNFLIRCWQGHGYRTNGNGGLNMTELELYKLCCTEDNEYGICLAEELGWVNSEEFCVWVSYIDLGFFIDGFKKLFGNLFDDGGLAANMRSDCVCINLSDALGDYVQLEEIFPKNKYKH